jgi:hypothetical protein
MTTRGFSKAAPWAVLLLLVAGCAAEQRATAPGPGEVEAPPPSYPGLRVDMVGVVLDRGGTPVGGCRIEVRDHRGETVFRTRTAANGRYSIPWIPMEGGLSVVVAPEGCDAVVRRYGSSDAFVRSPPVEVRVACGGSRR